MAALVYVLCALTSLLCVILLGRAYMETKAKLLFWCCLGFAGFALNNTILFLDIVVFPEVDYLINYRTFPAVVGMIVMIYGLIMEEV